MARIFLSHSSQDAAQVRELCAELESRGHACWLAPRDIGSGRLYPEVIEGAIRSCDLLVLLLSVRSNRSQWVLREVEAALRFGKPIIPVRLDDACLSDGLSFLISIVQSIEAYPPPLSPHVDTLMEAISNPLGRVTPVSAHHDTWSTILRYWLLELHDLLNNHSIDAALLKAVLSHASGAPRHGHGELLLDDESVHAAIFRSPGWKERLYLHGGGPTDCAQCALGWQLEPAIQQVLVSLAFNLPMRTCVRGLQFCLVPPGRFPDMGTSITRPFFMSESLVGRAWWAQATNNLEPNDDQPAFGIAIADLLPVLERLDQESPIPRPFVVPTSDQWRFACSALPPSPWQRNDDGGVSSVRVSAFGIKDLLGRAWQYCAVGAGYEMNGGAVDPRGSWTDSVPYPNTGFRREDYGVRLVMNI